MSEHSLSEREIACIVYREGYDPWYIYLQLQWVCWQGDPSEHDGARFCWSWLFEIQLLAIHVHELAVRYVHTYIHETCPVPYKCSGHFVHNR